MLAILFWSARLTDQRQSRSESMTSRAEVIQDREAELLSRAKANSGSFYFFFKSKEDLLLEVLDWYKRNLDPVLLAPLQEQTHDPVEQIFALLKFYRANVLRTEFGFGCPIGRLALEIDNAERLLVLGVFESRGKGRFRQVVGIGLDGHEFAARSIAGGPTRLFQRARLFGLPGDPCSAGAGWSAESIRCELTHPAPE